MPSSLIKADAAQPVPSASGIQMLANAHWALRNFRWSSTSLWTSSSRCTWQVLLLRRALASPSRCTSSQRRPQPDLLRARHRSRRRPPRLRPRTRGARRLGQAPVWPPSAAHSGAADPGGMAENIIVRFAIGLREPIHPITQRALQSPATKPGLRWVHSRGGRRGRPRPSAQQPRVVQDEDVAVVAKTRSVTKWVRYRAILWTRSAIFHPNQPRPAVQAIRRGMLHWKRILMNRQSRKCLEEAT